jgi:hypothetical protein
MAALQWVINGYTLTLAAFLLIGGSLVLQFRFLGAWSRCRSA